MAFLTHQIGSITCPGFRCKPGLSCARSRWTCD